MNVYNTPAITVLISAIFAFGSVSITRAQAACNGRDLFTAGNCQGDATSESEAELFKLINAYRKANNRPEIKPSVPLSMLANRRMLDLRLNVRKLTHSWSNCRYDIADQKTWPCLIEAPQRFHTGYAGQGYETLYRTTTGNVAGRLALDSWKKSALHNAIILNLGQFKDLRWDELGVAIDGPYASLWFGCPGAEPVPGGTIGLGVSYDEAVEGLTKVLALDKRSSVKDGDRWIGYTTDKKLKLELIGSPLDINKATVSITAKSEPDGKLPPQKLYVLSTLLKNLFPEWPDIDRWLEASMAAIAQNRTASRTKVVRKVSTELRANGRDALQMTIKPQSKAGYYEVF